MKEAYDLDWPHDPQPLDIEFAFIKAGGHIVKDGVSYGKGKFYHYRQAMTLLWPEDDHHRWSDLVLRRKCEEDILVLMGSGDSNKTYSSARYILANYWADPERTLWLVSSTEMRGAELRIWGKIKELFNRARSVHPWLAGSVIDSRTCITTDRIDRTSTEARALTKGVIFIPCKRAENYVGLGVYSGIKPPKDGRLGHCGDEVSFMERSFLQAYANWFGKANFEGILQGNITDTEDPLGVAGEPLEGWSEWQDTGKTQEWRSKWYGAWVIALDGRDSPNFDPPQTSKPRFPYLINAKKLEAVAQTEGADSPLYWMQCVGKPQPGAEKLKVITRQLCEQNKAFEKVIWQGTTITDVLGLDAAYGGEGGDRCVLERIRFGLDVTGQNVIQCFPKQIVPVNSRLAETPETQIVRWVMKFAEGFNIPPEHLFFDGRSKLAVEFGRIWSSQVNAIDFGGPATDRPVSDDHYVYDEEKKQRRHKRCNEHYSKFVTELWFAIYYLIKGQQLRELPMDIAEEGWKRIWKMTKGNPPRIEVESKVDMKKRTTRSPDLFDSLVTAVEGARRLGFIIKNLKMAKAALEEDDEWLERANQRYRNFIKRHELNYQ